MASKQYPSAPEEPAQPSHTERMWLGDRWARPALVCWWPNGRFAEHPERKPRVRWDHPIFPQFMRLRE